MSRWQYVKDHFEIFAEKGIPKEVSGIDYLRIKTANRLMLMGSYILIVFISVNLLSQLWIPLVCDFAILLAFYFSYKLNSHGNFRTGIPLAVFTVIIATILAGLAFKSNQGYQYLILSMLGLPILLFPKDCTKSRFASQLIVVLGFLYFEYFSSHFGLVTLSPQLAQTFHVIFIASAFAILLGQFLFWESVNIDSRKTLLDQENQLIQSEHLSRIGSLAAGIVHEINNPLSIISSTTSTIPKILKTNRPDSVQQTLEVINRQKNAVERIGKIISGMKSLSRMGHETDHQKHDIHELVLESIAHCRKELQKAKIKVNYIPNAERSEIFCNRTLITQVFVNLITNAIDAIETQDQRWIEIAANIEKNKFTILFKDSGPRLSESLAKEIQKPFFTTKPAGKG
ncbi:MAG: hypothetical protein KDD61_09340, partial [Bdellovibrionales bacterium]|nr:hypothetical protein [Bdellovibrionales bacterium]